MIRAANWVAGLQGWRRAVFAIFVGAASVLAFAPVYAWPVLFITFGTLVWLLDGCRRDHTGFAPTLICAGVTGFWFGFGFFLAGLYWIGEAFLVEPWRHAWFLPLVMTFLPAGMALFFAGACALAITMWLPGPGRVLALAIALGLAEYARGHVLTGLPWNLIGYGLTFNDATMQLAALFGVYALSLLAVLLFASPAAIWAPEGSHLGRRKAGTVFAALLLAALGIAYVWGERRLAHAEPDVTGVRLRLVQANVDQADKWRPENSAEIFADYLDLTLSDGLGWIDLVIWPETAVPFPLADAPDALYAIGEALPQETALLLGSGRFVQVRDARGRFREQRAYNSLLIIDHDGRVVGVYDKIHLVPFGEYLPFQAFLESLGVMQLTGVRGGFSAGTGPRLVEIPGAPPASPLICYEIIFPHDVTEPGRRPGWLLNLTNDAWFGSSAGPYQHFHQARVRAVEQSLPVVRSANTGISAVIDPYGRTFSKIGLGEKGILDVDLPNAGAPTFFVQFGTIIELSVLALAFAFWFACHICGKRVRLMRA